MEVLSIPRLAPGCRLHPTANILLIPEGALNLSGPSREILLLVDGQRTVGAIVDELLCQFQSVSATEMQPDVLSLLGRLQERGVVQA